MNEECRNILNKKCKYGDEEEYTGIQNADRYGYDLDITLLANKNRNLNLGKFEVHDLVLEWQNLNSQPQTPQTKEDMRLIEEALIESYFPLLRAKIHAIYNFAFKTVNGDKNKIAGDITSEAFIMLKKCLSKFQMVDNASFTSYYLGECRNHMIETARRKYFEVAKQPSAVYKKMRKAQNERESVGTNIQYSKVCMIDNDGDIIEDVYFAVTDEISSKARQRIEDRDFCHKLYSFLILNNFDEKYVKCLIATIGLYDEKYKQSELLGFAGVAASTLSKYLREIKDFLATNYSEFENYQPPKCSKSDLNNFKIKK